ncbi:MAG: hypothetical protein LKJ76_01100 [Lachnospiraceae bacterium]|nr:hypothetical protein [Lachnospiraceae bacterium]
MAGMLLLSSLPAGCSKTADCVKWDASPYYDSTAAMFREMCGLVGGSEGDVAAAYGDRRNEGYEDAYYVTVFGKEETAVADYKYCGAGNSWRQVSDFKIFLHDSKSYYIDYNEALTAVFGDPVSSDQTPYEGDHGVTVWNNYDPGNGGEVRFCHSGDGDWFVIRKAE